WFKHAAEHARKAGSHSFVVSLTNDPGRLPILWWELGTPSSSVHVPIFLDGELPEPLTRSHPQPGTEDLWLRLSQLSEQLERDRGQRASVQEGYARLQARLDQEAAEFNAEAAALKQRGAVGDLHRQATLFMQYNLERFEAVLTDSLRARPLVGANK